MGGCIFYEMAIGKALFAGDCEIDQLFTIFRILGTPDNNSWPGVEQFTDYKKTFPKWKRTFDETSKIKIKDKIGEEGADLLCNMICYIPENRISCTRALAHDYFNDLDKSDFKEQLE